jgi:probable blue pigment (indigoidine) exporter
VLGTLNIGAFFALLFVSAYRLPGGVAAVLGAPAPARPRPRGALLDERATRRAVASAVVAARRAR